MAKGYSDRRKSSPKKKREEIDKKRKRKEQKKGKMLDANKINRMTADNRIYLR